MPTNFLPICLPISLVSRSLQLTETEKVFSLYVKKEWVQLTPYVSEGVADIHLEIRRFLPPLSCPLSCPLCAALLARVLSLRPLLPLRCALCARWLVSCRCDETVASDASDQTLPYPLAFPLSATVLARLLSPALSLPLSFLLPHPHTVLTRILCARIR